MFQSPFFKWLKNSLIIAVTDTVIVLFTSSVLGYTFARYHFRGKEFLFSVLMFTMMVPAQVTMITSFLLIDRIGLYDSLLALSFFSTQQQTDLSAVMAASALIMIPSAIVFIAFQKQFIEGIALTGMK